MTREKETSQAALRYCQHNIPSTPNMHLAISTAFEAGAEWADSHPASPWHKVADGDLPPKAKNNNRIVFSIDVLLRLDKKTVAFGCYDYTYKKWFIGLKDVHPTHWMEIPELPK